jgi:Putative phage tail protein
MSWLRSQNAKPDYTGLQLQTSVSTLPIPIVWGQTKIAANVVWYQNFQAHAGDGGGKGGGAKGGMFGGGGAASNSYTYTADLILALCEGPITGIGIIWKDESIYTLAMLGLILYNGATPQATWPYLSALYPGQSLGYQGTAYVCAASYDLGDAAAISNHNFEILGVFAGTGINGIDADPALVINDFLTNPQYGASFNPASINAATLFGSGGDASLQTYCKAMGFAFSPALTSQEQGSSILSRWLQILSCAAVWSGGELKFIPYGDTAITAGGQTAYSNQFSVPTPVPQSSGIALPAYVTVCPAADFVSDGGVVYAFSNAPLAFIGAAAPTATGTYGMPTQGTYVFASADEGKAVVITYTYATPTSYAPNLTPVYALTDFDFIDEKGNKDPVQVERADVFSLPTIQRIECLSRGNQYSATPVEARDQGQIEVFGPRVGSVIEAHEICDELRIGPLVAQTILQRELYVRTKFTFKLSWEYCLLDPMDVVTITDANLGLSNYPVRIVTVEEDDKGLLAVTAEEFVSGVSTPAFYRNASSGGAVPNWAVPAVPINAPLIYEPPPQATGDVAQIWVGASGSGVAATSPQWGGANVFVSVDNVTYAQVAVITAPLRQGVLTAALSAASGWDTVDMLAVSLAESGATLSGTSQTAAQQGATLALVDSELLAYESATLTGANAYTLTGLARGLGGTDGAAHASGAPFARIDGAVVKYDLPTNLVGQALYLKFQSFNAFGGGLQDLSTCVAYPYTPTGSGVSSPIAAQLASGIATDLGEIPSTATVFDDFGALTGALSGSVNLGTAP